MEVFFEFLNMKKEIQLLSETSQSLYQSTVGHITDCLNLFIHLHSGDEEGVLCYHFYRGRPWQNLQETRMEIRKMIKCNASRDGTPAYLYLSREDIII